MRLLYLICLSIFISLGIQAQDDATLNEWHQQGLAAIEASQYEKATELFLKAQTAYSEAQEWAPYLEVSIALVESYQALEDPEQAVNLGEAAIARTNEANYTDINLSLLHKAIGRIYYQYNDFKSALPQLEQALLIRKSINQKDPELARDYGNLGILSRFANRSGKAIEYLETALSLQDDKNVLARLYSELGVNYQILGDFRKSLDYQNQAIILLQNDTDEKALAIALLEKGITLTKVKREKVDRALIKQALEIFINLGDYENQVICLEHIGTSFFMFSAISSGSKLDSALLYYEKALKLAQEHLPRNHESTTNLTLNMSNVWAIKGSTDKAKAILNDQNIEQKVQQSPKSLFASLVSETKGKIASINKNYPQALQAYQKQIIATVPSYNETDIKSLPSIDQLKQTISYDHISDALAFKARCWYHYYKFGGENPDHLNQALKTFECFDDMVDYIRTVFANSGSNIAWSDLTLDAYENAIDICLDLYEVSKDEAYKKKALFYSEKSKALSLLESFQNTKAKAVSGLPKEALQKEYNLKLDLIDLEQEIFQLEQENDFNLAEDIKELKKQLFDKKQEYEALLTQLEKDHPQYYKTKHQLNILTVDAMQALLKPDQAFVEYFVGDSSITAFKVTTNNFEVVRLGKGSLIGNRVNEFRESIYGYFLSTKSRDEQIRAQYAQQYSQRALRLYQDLVQPLGDLPKRLVIIPAGALCDMPFEALLSDKVADPEAYASHPFLVREHSISYSYSASLLKEMMGKQHPDVKGTFAGFAPSFKEDAVSVIRGKRFALSPLAYNKPEIENINQLLGTGIMFEGATATEEQFKKIASDYEIIHFATHGMANSNDPDYSLLAFTEVEDDIENEFLYVSDLYNLQLNTEMVVLSACETALGKHFRGEGIMSLARGFSYAGTKSIFTTLWSVNDQSTYNIIRLFYSNLQTGLDKDEALQKAKLDYLKQAKGLTAHPFLWSPYILIGDVATIPSIQRTNTFWYIFGAVAALVLASLLWWIKRPK